MFLGVFHDWSNGRRHGCGYGHGHGQAHGHEHVHGQQKARLAKLRPTFGRPCLRIASCWRKFEHHKWKTRTSKNRKHKSSNIRTSKDRRAEPEGSRHAFREASKHASDCLWRQIMPKNIEKHSFNRICSIFDFRARQALALLRVAAQ